jgi:hypothetical protein
VDVPHRMTPIAEAAPEPKPLPLHVQVAARDVMTGGCVCCLLVQIHSSACFNEWKCVLRGDSRV